MIPEWRCVVVVFVAFVMGAAIQHFVVNGC
jgi:hypothetical protein